MSDHNFRMSDKLHAIKKTSLKKKENKEKKEKKEKMMEEPRARGSKVCRASFQYDFFIQKEMYNNVDSIYR